MLNRLHEYLLLIRTSEPSEGRIQRVNGGKLSPSILPKYFIFHVKDIMLNIVSGELIAVVNIINMFNFGSNKL